MKQSAAFKLAHRLAKRAMEKRAEGGGLGFTARLAEILNKVPGNFDLGGKLQAMNPHARSALYGGVAGAGALGLGSALTGGNVVGDTAMGGLLGGLGGGAYSYGRATMKKTPSERAAEGGFTDSSGNSISAKQINTAAHGTPPDVGGAAKSIGTGAAVGLGGYSAHGLATAGDTSHAEILQRLVGERGSDAAADGRATALKNHMNRNGGRLPSGTQGDKVMNPVVRDRMAQAYEQAGPFQRIKARLGFTGGLESAAETGLAGDLRGGVLGSNAWRGIERGVGRSGAVATSDLGRNLARQGAKGSVLKALMRNPRIAALFAAGGAGVGAYKWWQGDGGQVQ